MKALTVFRIILALAIGFGAAKIWQDNEPHAAQAPLAHQQPAG